MNIKKELETKIGIASGIYLNDIDIDPLTIKAIMINEVVPSDPVQDFYGTPDADYLKSTIPLFQGAGAEANSIQDILKIGIYITNAVKHLRQNMLLIRVALKKVCPIWKKNFLYSPI